MPVSTHHDAHMTSLEWHIRNYVQGLCYVTLCHELVLIELPISYRSVAIKKVHANGFSNMTSDRLTSVLPTNDNDTKQKDMTKPHLYFVTYRQKKNVSRHNVNTVFIDDIAGCHNGWRAISHDKVGTMALLGFQYHRNASFVMTGDTASCHNYNMRFHHMMTLSNGYIFPRYWPFLWGESTGHRWIPLTKANDASLWCFLWCAPEQTVEVTFETSVIWRHHSAYCDDTVMSDTLELFSFQCTVPQCSRQHCGCKQTRCTWVVHQILYQVRDNLGNGKHHDVIKWKHFRVTGPLCGEFTGHR